MRDVNGRAGKRVKDLTVGSLNKEVQNDNRQRMINTCKQFNLKTLNRLYTRTYIHNIIRISRSYDQ